MGGRQYNKEGHSNLYWHSSHILDENNVWLSILSPRIQESSIFQLYILQISLQ